MALINSKNRYIKLEKDGLYEVYASEAARKRVKESTSSVIILTKYRELLADLEKPEQDEFRYYDPKGFAAIYDPLVLEYETYVYDLTNHIVGHEYPIMSEYYPDVVDSIPEIIETAFIPSMNKDVEEAYIKAKQLKRFGETTDA